jgi:hypothetical protein
MSTNGEFPATTGLPEKDENPRDGPMIEGKFDSEKDSWLLSLEPGGLEFSFSLNSFLWDHGGFLLSTLWCPQQIYVTHAGSSRDHCSV